MQGRGWGATRSDVTVANSSNLDFPSLDAPCNPTSLSEALTIVLSAISQIISVAGHLMATVQTPFLTLCDAVMGDVKYGNYGAVADFLCSVSPSFVYTSIRGIPYCRNTARGRSCRSHVDTMSEKKTVQTLRNLVCFAPSF